MDPKMEGVEKRLSDQHDNIVLRDSDKARRETSVADIPYEIEAIVTPPRALIKILESREGALCGQAFQLDWETGPWKGLPVTGYCSEPLCISEHVCTGTRFVPHVDQWTTTDAFLRRRRTMTPQEIVAAVRMFARKASAQTGRNEEREDKQILDHVKLVWTKTLQHLRDSSGNWRR